MSDLVEMHKQWLDAYIHYRETGDNPPITHEEFMAQVRDKAIEDCKKEAVAWTIQNPATHDGIIQNQVASKIAKHIEALKDPQATGEQVSDGRY